MGINKTNAMFTSKAGGFNMNIISIDWNVFNYKFSSNPRCAFESLAYTLFCFEFKQKVGIFRYFNQPYIETQPIALDNGDVVCFQAKYYDAVTKISDKKDELIEAITNASVKYQGINRYIIYTNKELATSSKKEKVKPDYQISIEKSGEEKGIHVEWRVPSNFEIMLLNPELNSIKDLYFNPNNGLQQFAERINNRSSSLLNSIKSDITFGDTVIKFENSKSAINEFIHSENKVFVVYGNAGTGKSGYIKDFATHINNRQTSNLLVFAATDFDADDENSLLSQFGNYRLEDLLSLYSPAEEKYCIIESAEKYCNFKNTDVLKTAMHKFLEYGWRIIVTIRIQYKEGFNNAILDGIATDQYYIENVKKENLRTISEKYGFELPSNSSLENLICNLFYLKLYLDLIFVGRIIPSDSQSFKRMIWNQVICNESKKRDNMPVRRETFIINMAKSMLIDGLYIYHAKASDDYEAITELEKQGIIIPYEAVGTWVFNHDIYEEIIVKHIFDNIYDNTKELITIPESFNNSLRSRKMYRIWLESMLENPDGSFLSSLINILKNSDFSQSWQDETLIALMNSENKEAFQIMESLFGGNGYALFTRAVFLLNTACKCVKRNSVFIKLVQTQKINSYHFTEPTGEAWNTVFNYIYQNKTTIPWDGRNLNVVIEAMNSWVSNNPEGETTFLIGQTALFLKDKYWDDGKKAISVNDDSISVGIIKIILMSAIEIKQELSSIVDRIIQKKAFCHNDQDYLFLTKALSNVFECGKVCIAIPNKIIELLWNYWFYTEENDHFCSTGMETFFGLNDHLHFNYYPSSAFQTPIFALLNNAPKQSIDFILNLSNHAAECYKNSSLNNESEECYEIQITLTKTENTNQICSDRLWKIHRGTGTAPYILESILMAFEEYVLTYIGNVSENEAKDFCLYLLRNSNNASITAIVISAITAYPNKLFEISCILLKTKEIFMLDKSRLIAESSANFLRGMPGKNQLFDKERINSNNKEFRKKSFKDIILGYQMNEAHLPQKVFEDRCKKLYDAIDDAIIDINNWHPQFQAYYYSFDLRKFKQVGEPIEKDGNIAIPIQPDLPQQIVEYSEKVNAEYIKATEDTALMLWASLRFRKEEGYRDYCKFEDNPLLAYQEIKAQFEALEKESSLFSIDSIVFTTVVLLRDFENKLDKDQNSFCRNALVKLSYKLIDQNSSLLYRNDLKAAIISGIAIITNQESINCDADNPIIIVLSFMLDYKKLLYNDFLNPLKDLWPTKRDLARKLFSTFVHFYPKFSECKEKDAFLFIKKNRKDIQKHLLEDNCAVDSDEISKLDYNTLMYICCINEDFNSELLQLTISAGKLIWKKLFYDFNNTDIRHNYRLEFSYMHWFAEYLLNITDNERQRIIQEFIPLVRFRREFNDFLSEIVTAEDKHPRYDAFWNLWSLMQDSIFQTFEKNSDDYKNTDSAVNIGWGYEDVLQTFLLAGPWWKEGIAEWHSLKNQNKTFYLVVANRLGFNPTTLFSIARVINTVGKNPLKNEGVVMLSDIIRNNPHLKEKPLPENTLYYMEEYMFSFVKDHIVLLQTDIALKRKAEIVLDYLVTRGSTMGFLLREEII